MIKADDPPGSTAKVNQLARYVSRHSVYVRLHYHTPGTWYLVTAVDPVHGLCTAVPVATFNEDHHGINEASGRILQGSGCSLLRARKHVLVGSRYGRGRRPNPAQPVTLNPNRTQNGPETGQKRGCAAFSSLNVANRGSRFAS